MAWPAPASAAPNTGPTRPAPMMPTPSLPEGRAGAHAGTSPERQRWEVSRLAETIAARATSLKKSSGDLGIDRAQRGGDRAGHGVQVHRREAQHPQHGPLPQ